MKRLRVLPAIILILVGVGIYTRYVISRSPPMGIITSEACQEQYRCRDCNLLFISVDSLRADHMGVFGYLRPTTPKIDNLQANAILFRNYFSASFLTSITQMSVLTGMYPTTSGYINYGSPFASSNLTMAQMLKQHGYITSSLHTSPEYVNPMFAGYSNFHRGFDWHAGLEERSLSEANRQYIRDELDLLRQRKEKFFLWLSVGSIHWPYGFDVPDVFTDRSYQGPLKDRVIDWHTSAYILNNMLYPIENSSPQLRYRESMVNGEIQLHKDEVLSRTKTPLTQDDLQHIIDKYDNGVIHFDAFFGELYGHLQQTGLDKTTVIVIAGEHGEDLSEHGYVSHYDLYDTTVHTPFIIFTPSGWGSSVKVPTGSVDVLPTIFDILGVPVPAQVQGISRLPAACRAPDETDAEEAVFIQRTPFWENLISYAPLLETYAKLLDTFSDKDIDIAIRTSRWKYIYRRSERILQSASWYRLISGSKYEQPREELYDILQDPMEQKNVIGEHPDVARQLNKRLMEWWARVNRPVDPQNTGTKVQEYF